MYGASGDAHLRSEVSGACRGLSFVLEALWRRGRVHIYRHLRAELLCSLRELLLAMSRCEVLGRDSPVGGSAGYPWPWWRSGGRW